MGYQVNLLCTLRHQNLVTVFGVCLEENRTAIVMEYCCHGTLTNLIEKHCFSEWKKKLTLLHEIASVMSFLHMKNVLHRDLKCDNILIGEHYHAKLADLGISKLLTETSNQHFTAYVGTSSYIAPEVALGQQYDSKCDVFSFAIVMYQIMFEKTQVYGDIPFVEAKVARDPTCRPVIPRDRDYNADENHVIELMKKSWSHCTMDRPSFAELEQEFAHLLQKT